MTTKRVKVLARGYLFDRIVEPGEEVVVPAKLKGKWFEEVDGPKPGRKPKDDTATEA
jgi:hypothetical protein